MSRADILRGLLGKPWRANAKGPDAFDCWHLACEVERSLFGRELPGVALPDHPTWKWIVEAIDGHPERANWRSVEPGPLGLVTAGDGALVLMASSKRAAHIGVWLVPELRVIHCDELCGVVFEPLAMLKRAGWQRLMFFEPIRKQ